MGFGLTQQQQQKERAQWCFPTCLHRRHTCHSIKKTKRVKALLFKRTAVGERRWPRLNQCWECVCSLVSDSVHVDDEARSEGCGEASWKNKKWTSMEECMLTCSGLCAGMEFISVVDIGDPSCHWRLKAVCCYPWRIVFIHKHPPQSIALSHHRPWKAPGMLQIIQGVLGSGNSYPYEPVWAASVLSGLAPTVWEVMALEEKNKSQKLKYICLYK